MKSRCEFVKRDSFDKKKIPTSLLAIIVNGPQTCDNALQTLPRARLETFLSHGWNTFHRYKAKKKCKKATRWRTLPINHAGNSVETCKLAGIVCQRIKWVGGIKRNK